MKILNKILLGVLIIAIICSMAGCKDKTEPVPTPTPTIEITPTPTTTPFVAPTPSPTPTPTPTPIPTPIPTPTPTPTPLFPVITKSPTSETVEEGGSCYFVARYENATIAVWHFLSPDGQTDITYIGAQEQFAPVEIINGMYSTMQLKNIPYSLNGWRVYCRYSNNYGSVNTKAAYITVIPAPTPVIITPEPIIVTPTPTPEPTPTPTPTPTPEPTPTQTPEPTPEPTPTETELFYNSAYLYVHAILTAQNEELAAYADDEEEYQLHDYLIDYDIDFDNFTLYLTYDIMQNTSDLIKSNMFKSENEKITLSESAIEIMQFNFKSLKYAEHIIVTFQHEDSEFFVLDLVTNTTISIDGQPE